MSFLSDMKKQGLTTVTRRTPVWAGPGGDGSQGGVTFSLLSRFLVCRERFRALVVEGLQPHPTFNHKIEYGNYWHYCEEALAKGTDWKFALENYRKVLCAKYRLSQDEVNKWAKVCLHQFPEYVRYWQEHPDVVARKPVAQEQVFDERYKLPSGRMIRLRGKWDSVDKIEGVLWLQENKSKGDVDEGKIKRQLKYDLQTMMYLVSLKEAQDRSFWNRSNKSWRELPVAGVRYNIVQRPLSGEKGTIKQKQNESEKDYWQRLADYFRKEPERYFHRWKIPVSQEDIDRFREKSLDPILEQLCHWWDVQADKNPSPLEGWATHYTMPFGVFNPLLEGGYTDIDDYILTGSTVGLTRTDNLFPELQ